MNTTFITFVFTTSITICIIGLILCGILLSIMFTSRKYSLSMKLYLYFFERDDYNLYKEMKSILYSGGIIPVYSRFTDTNETKGIYFIPFEKSLSVWKDDKCCLSEFHKLILDEIVKMGNLEEIIEQTRVNDNIHHKELNERMKQLEKEIAETKAKLAKLNEQDNA